MLFSIILKLWYIKIDCLKLIITHKYSLLVLYTGSLKHIASYRSITLKCHMIMINLHIKDILWCKNRKQTLCIVANNSYQNSSHIKQKRGSSIHDVALNIKESLNQHLMSFLYSSYSPSQ